MTFIKVKFALESGESVYFNGVDVTDKIVKDGDYYTFVTDGIAAADFGTVYTFAIKVSGTSEAEESEKETLGVSVNDCLYLLKTSQTSSDKQKKLASALYNYGLRARICDHDCEGGTATCVSKAVCSICGEAYGEYGEHNCSLHSDDETHYYACDNEGCDFKKDEAAHSDDNDDGKCDVCEKESAA